MSALREPLRVVIAGGTGFIGRHIALRLRAAGHRVTVLSRSRPRELAEGLEWRAADLAHAVAPTLLDDVDVLVNCIGIKRELASGLSWERAHVELPSELAEAAARAGVAQVIHLSVAGCEGASVEHGAYLHSKARGEERLADAALPVTILRPGVVYGHGDDVLRNLADAIRAAPVFPVPEGGRAIVRVIAVEDVAEAVLRCIEVRSGRSAYDLVGPERLSLRELIARVARVCERRCIVVPTPSALLHVAASVLERVGDDPLITRSQLRLLARGVDGDPEPARAELGFVPRALDDATIAALLEELAPRLPSVRLVPDHAATRELAALGGRRPSWAFAAFALLAVCALLLGPLLWPSIWLRMLALEALLSLVAITTLRIEWARAWRPSAGALAWGLGAGLVMWAGAFAVAALLAAFAPELWRETASLYAWASEYPLVATLPMLIAIVAGEEVVWRGALGLGLASRIGAWPAVLVSGGLFALAHLSSGPAVLVLAAMLAGAMWTALAIRTRSLFASFIAHLGWDAALIWLTPL